MAEPLLSIRDLRVEFEKLVAVDGVSIDLYPGDVFGLIGPNGAGKTTTFRAVAGLQDFQRGEVRVVGKDILTHRKHARAETGFMFDNCPVYDQLSVVEFLEHFALAGQADDFRGRIDQCLEMTWLTEKRKALCSELSRGMKQRLTLAKTLLTDPSVLLLDEPASGIDPLGRIELRKLILLLREMGKAIVVSSHILSEMSEFCNKVGIMERGKLIRSGTIEELKRGLSSRPMLVRWRTPSGVPAELLQSSPAVGNLKLDGLAATFEFTGDDDTLDNLLAALVSRGVRVTEWRGGVSDLENILLQSGAKAVS